MNKYYIIFISFLLGSCTAPIHTFIVEGCQSTLKLYSDSTFKEKREGQSYSGIWRGDIAKDSIFVTTTTNSGMQILTMTPVKNIRL
jgi:hypothetical protein